MANDKPNAIKSNPLGANIPEIVAALAGAIGTIVYVVNSTTGYMAGQGVDAAVVACGVVAVVALLAKVALGGRLTGVLADVMLVGSEALLIVAFARFALTRVRLAADIYFIPVNYPAAEETALNVALVGVACYLIAIIALIVKAFIARDADRTALTLVPSEPAVS